MEKKTMGSFISALRRANGMTQRELGEKLFVSDKTVSRWETGESVPDLALIPLIAEIFGISTDELLRGERNLDSDPEKDERNDRRRQRSDRELKLMLSNRKRKHKNQLLVSLGISLIGLLAALMIDLAFSKGLIAFCVSGALFLISELLTVGFAMNALFEPEEGDPHGEEIERYNDGIKRSTVVISFLNICLLAFCLPLVTLIDGRNFGLLFGSWLGYGSVFTAVAFIVCYTVYILIKDRIFKLTERETRIWKCGRRVYVKCLCAGLCAVIVLFVGIGVWNDLIGVKSLIKEQVFYNATDFRTQMRIDYKNWYNEGYSRGDTELPSNDYGKVSKTVYGKDGEILFEFYYHPQLYRSIEFTESASDKMPVKVVTLDAYYDACDVFDTVNIILLAILILDPIVCTVIYIKKLNKLKLNKE